MPRRRPMRSGQSIPALVLFALGCARSGVTAEPPATPAASGSNDAAARVDVSVTEAGFTPSRIRVQKGRPVTFVFTRRTEHTCAKDVVVYVDSETTVRRRLPVGQPVEITVTFPESGEHGFSCSMKMRGAAVLVE